MQKFEAKEIGAFGRGPEAKAVWRKRIDMQDAYALAAAAKMHALHDREMITMSKRQLCAKLQEEAIPAVPDKEGAAAVAAAAAQEALRDLEACAKVHISHSFFFEILS